MAERKATAVEVPGGGTLECRSGKAVARRLGLRAVKPRWRDGVVMVCTDCGKGKQAPRFADWVKKALRKLGFKKRSKVVEVGCLGVCPKKPRVVVGLPTVGSCLVVDPKKDRKPLARFLSARLEV